MRMRRALRLGPAVVAAACAASPVGAPIVESVRVTVGDPALIVGQETRAEARVVGLDGEEIAGIGVRWRSDAPGVARVDADGTVRAVGPGDATIEAESAGVRGAAVVHVEDRVDGIEIYGKRSVMVGDSILLGARLTSRSGAPVARRVHWASLDFSVALVSKDGSVRGVGEGTVRIVATIDAVADTVEVRVNPAEPPAGP